MFTRRRRVRAVRDNVAPAWPFVGMALVACDFFLYAASVLVAPWWAVVLLGLAWVGLLRLAVTWWTPHPRRIVAAALGAVVLWFVVLVAGGALLGWGS